MNWSQTNKKAINLQRITDDYNNDRANSNEAERSLGDQQPVLPHALHARLLPLRLALLPRRLLALLVHGLADGFGAVLREQLRGKKKVLLVHRCFFTLLCSLEKRYCIIFSSLVLGFFIYVHFTEIVFYYLISTSQSHFVSACSVLLSYSTLFKHICYRLNQVYFISSYRHGKKSMNEERITEWGTVVLLGTLKTIVHFLTWMCT